MSSTYDATVYDLFHDPHGEDVDFYTRLARKAGGPVLELGVGIGRTALPAARAGVRMTGIDKDRAMLDRLRTKLEDEPPEVREGLTLVEADMRTFALTERFALVQIPFRAFLHNLDRTAQLDCLHRCAEHLRPGGRLALNVFHPSLAYMSEHAGAYAGVWRWRDERTNRDGQRVLLSDATRYDPVKQTLRSKLRYETFSPDGALLETHLQHLELAYLYPGDLRELLTEAGFADIRIDGGFDGRPLTRDGGELVVRARRP